MKVEDTNALRFILQDELYLLNEDKSLYSGTPKSEPEIQTPQPVFNYLGANKKNFLILVSYGEQEYIKEEHLTALEAVLGRIGHNREDVAIVNVIKQDSNLEQLSAYFEPKIMLILGEAAIPAGMAQPKFNSIDKSSGKQVLYTYSFDEMMTTVENKKAFWEQIKNL
ncbi:MAG: hypothetical protein ACHQHN_04585 [Sphingobacteriales bacterium]